MHCCQRVNTAARPRRLRALNFILAAAFPAINARRGVAVHLETPRSNGYF
jgi:hypothetical protein